ncbi:endonuclease domain-containing protein [Microbacterium sp.]|uniref:endonuclease domain-containing protein n=1 Tax=Microbacterium sp. TaxID=51671 RepID=UPI003A86DDF1
MRRTPLPAHLGTVFSVADAREAGVSSSRLRAKDLDRPFRAVRTAAASSAGAAHPEDRILALAVAYRHRMTTHEFFSHVTAAVAWGVPLPRWLVAERELDVCVLHPRRAPNSVNVSGHAVLARMASVVVHPEHGFPLASPATTWATLGAFLPWRDLVVAADAIVREPMHRDDPPALATVEQLRAAVAAGRRAGARDLREALPSVNTRSRSRPETLLRLLLADAGLPAAEVNADVFDAGVWLGQVDLVFRAARVAVEYEGTHHVTDPEQWRRDIERYERLAAAGWTVIRVTNAQLTQASASVVARVRNALAARR